MLPEDDRVIETCRNVLNFIALYCFLPVQYLNYILYNIITFKCFNVNFRLLK